MEFAHMFDQLVLSSDSKPLQVLGKFETQQGLVHTYCAAPGGALLFELPRYDLGFELEDGRLSSKNYSGFVLAEKQQLEDAMCDLTQYLVLDSNGQTLLITPAGKVEKTSDRVLVSGPTRCDSDRRLHAYDLHPRFGTLDARTGATAIEARRARARAGRRSGAAAGVAAGRAGARRAGGGWAWRAALRGAGP